MKLKSLLKKIVPGKKSTEPLPVMGEEEDVQHEASFDKLETRIETSAPANEVDVYVNDEKTNIHTVNEETKVGRDPAQADIIISELIVSKLHCIIYSSGDDFFIKDNNSTNGIYIGDQKISEQKIEDGEVILLGKKGTVKLVFHKRR